ncbi:MAG: hypothetical protein R2865_01495 [Deinococcales bacterium]
MATATLKGVSTLTAVQTIWLAPSCSGFHALAGTVNIDFDNEASARVAMANPSISCDISGPSTQDIAQHMSAAMKPEVFKKIHDGIENQRGLECHSRSAWRAFGLG